MKFTVLCLGFLFLAGLLHGIDPLVPPELPRLDPEVSIPEGVPPERKEEVSLPEPFLREPVIQLSLPPAFSLSRTPVFFLPKPVLQLPEAPPAPKVSPPPTTAYSSVMTKQPADPPPVFSTMTSRSFYPVSGGSSRR
jgi:hypothetical protein